MILTCLSAPEVGLGQVVKGADMARHVVAARVVATNLRNLTNKTTERLPFTKRLIGIITVWWLIVGFFGHRLRVYVMRLLSRTHPEGPEKLESLRVAEEFPGRVAHEVAAL